MPLAVPFVIQLHPTNKCNVNCRFCWRHDSLQDSLELPDERWLEIADEICSLRVPQVSFVGGGEPLLRPRVVLEMMEKFSRADIEGSLITNGTLITEEVAKRFVELQWKSVEVSIHAPTAQLNDFLMGKDGAFNLALRGIKNIITYKRRRNTAFPRLIMRIVVTRFNFPTIPEFIRFARLRGVEVVAIRMVDEEAGTAGKFSLSEEGKRQFDEVIRHAKGVAKEVGIGLHFEFRMESSALRDEDTYSHSAPQEKEHIGPRHGVQGKEMKDARCPIPFSALTIFANGTASPCCNLFNMQFKRKGQRAGWLEDVTHKPIRQIWRGGFAALRLSMLSKEKLCPVCMRCDMNVNGPVEAFFHHKLGYFRKHKRYREGIQFGLEQVKEHLNNPSLYRYISEFHMELEEYGAVIEVLERLERLGGDVEDLYFLLGRCHFEIGEYRKALTIFKKNLTKSVSQDNMFRTWHLMAVCHRRLRHYDKMKHGLNKARELAEQLRKKGVFEDEHSRDVVEQWPAPFFHEGFRHLRESKEYKDGIRFGLQQLKEYPDSAVLHHYIGEFHMELEEHDKAIEHLSKAVQLDQKMEWTRFSLGKCFYLTGRYEEAERAFRDNLRLTSDGLSHYHSRLFLAMTADARNDKRGCRKALQSLKSFKEFFGREVLLEQKFLARLEKKRMLPAWFRAVSRGKGL